MSFLSGIVLGFLEKELSQATPEVESYLLTMVGDLAKDVVLYIEKKTGLSRLSPSISAGESTNG